MKSNLKRKHHRFRDTGEKDDDEKNPPGGGGGSKAYHSNPMRRNDVTNKHY